MAKAELVLVKVKSLTGKEIYRRAGIAFKNNELQFLEVTQETKKVLDDDEHIKVDEPSEHEIEVFEAAKKEELEKIDAELAALKSKI